MKTQSFKEIAPDERKITQIQAKRLAALADVKPEELHDLTIGKLGDKLKWKVDPMLFFFRKVCGKVVKKDPITGIEYPVPFATVYVEDTDCHLISYFPPGWPWGWFFPFHCTREVIATTKTDKCGNFCVWVPRFDIDWILRWRLERRCYPIIFRRPNLGDILKQFPPPVVGPWPPIPDPNPDPWEVLANLPSSVIDVLGGASAGQLVNKLAGLKEARMMGAMDQNLDAMMNQRLFTSELPPPLPTEMHRAQAGQGMVAAKGANAIEGIRAAVATKLGLEPNAKEIANFHPKYCIGPFVRCYNVIVPEWQIIYDIPDITFRVGQDVDGDGTEETIYSEGFFDVRWDAGTIPPVTLHASSIAKESHTCDTPTVPCGDVPAILFAGFMPLTLPAYFNAATGYALRPNRPSNDGLTPSPTDLTRPISETPFCWTLQLYGCVNVKSAKYYRILQSNDGGATFSAITGLSWNNYLNTGGIPIPITADASGWYAVNPIHPITLTPIPRTDLEFENLILDWPTPALAQTVLKVEIGDGAKASLGMSAQVAVQSDNTSPSVIYTQLAWKFVGESDAAFRNLLGIPCPTIHRGTTPKDIEVVFQVAVSAHHLRAANIWPSGCGGGSFSLESGTTSHWHTTVADNSVVLEARYKLAAGALEGAYGFNAYASSCAMNPSGADGGNLLPTDWYYDPIYIYSNPSLGVAVVNEN